MLVADAHSAVLVWRFSHCAERFAGTVSRATDVYSFGIVLWEMVTGAKPFAGMSAGDIMQAVKAGKRPPWPTDCLPELVALGQACMHHEPSKRPTFDQVRGKSSSSSSAIASWAHGCGAPRPAVA